MLINGGFEDGLTGWRTDSPALIAQALTLGGRTVARIEVPAEAPFGSHALYQDLPARPGEVLIARGEVMLMRISDGAGAYLETVYLNAQGEALNALPQDHAVVSGHWTRLDTPLHHRIAVPPDCAVVRLRLAFHGHGEATFDNVSLERLVQPAVPPLDGPVTLTVSGEVVCDDLFGFGAEDDGWFHLAVNMEKGVAAEEIALCERRIRWVDPAWIRSFIHFGEWWPNRESQTFTFDSPGMASHYAALDLYQQIGARLCLVGADWNMDHLYDDAEAVAHAIGALYEHLIRERGYSCIQYWTLVNEPDSGFHRTRAYRFEHFTRIHQLVKAEFARRGLAIEIIGSDDADARAFFEECVRDPAYRALTDIFCSHTYPRSTCIPASIPEFFDGRLSALRTHAPDRPFIVGEMGFLGPWFTSHDNPLILTYPYAIWTAAFAIEGLNRGVAGFSFWTMHEVYYPFGKKMQFGLWDFKDNDWRTRPVYHAWVAFCRHARCGDPVRRCDSTRPDRVLGALVGSTLFFVNRGDEPARVRIEGFAPRQVRIMTEATLEGDGDCGVVEEIQDGHFTAPPQSFGYAL